VSEPEHYEQHYFEEDHERWFNNPNTALFEGILQRITRLSRDASVLDLGCGRGDLLKYLHRREPNLSLSGIDLAPSDPVEGINLLQGDVFTARFERQFDVVVSLAVIEHVSNVHAFVHRLHDLCRPGGLVIILTVNDQGVVYRTARVLARLRMTTPFNRLYSKHHLNHFNISSLRRLVEMHGLKVRETIRHNSPLAAVDIPPASGPKTAVFRLGIWGLFVLGRATGQTLLQTIVCERPEAPLS
jgi:2-polyprenyl-3-methyl-5-hydroxy-6-metoxy-1,4-benzoquinol methylase